MGGPLGIMAATMIACLALLLLHELADADTPAPAPPALVDAGVDAGPYRTPATPGPVKATPAPAPSSAEEPPPATVAQDLLSGLLSGRYLVAVAAALLLLVAALRAGLARLVHPWFASRPGGYVISLTTAVAAYLGTAWRAGAPVSIGIVLAAIGASLAAAGGWEAARDAIFGQAKGSSSSSGGGSS
jgi:hypothetical protein